MLALLLMVAAALTSAPQGGGTDIQRPLAVHLPAANVTLVGYVSGTGYPSVARYHHGPGTVDTVALTAVQHVDDHDRPALLRLPSGRVVAAWSKHSDTGYTAYSDDAGATWSTPVELSGNLTYAHLHLRSDGVNLIYRHGTDPGSAAQRLYVSSDSGASWGSPTTFMSGEYLTTYGGERIDVYRRENSLAGDDWDIDHAYYDGTWHKSDGTPLSVPFSEGDMTTVYAHASRRAVGISAAEGMLCLMSFAGVDDYPVVTDRRYHLATYDGGWSVEEVAQAGDGPIHFYGCAIESATSLYLVRPVDGVHQVWHYTKDGTWSGVQVSHSETDQLRTIVPTDARSDLPVVWDYGTWTAQDDWSMGLAGLARGVASSLRGVQSAWPSMRP